MPTLTIYLNEKNFLFLSGISKGKSSSLGKTIIEDWIAKEKNEKQMKEETQMRMPSGNSRVYIP